MGKKRKSKSKVKWGKIGAPKSAKRKAWLASLRRRKSSITAPKAKRKKRSRASSKGTSYQAQW